MTHPHEPDDGAIMASARAMFDRGAIGMCVLSLDGYHLHPNPTFCDMVDRTEEELKALRWTDLVDPESLAQAGDWRSALERDSRWHGELRMTTPSGSLVPALSIISLVRDDEGTPSYLFKQTIDLTHFKQLQESLREATAVNDSVLAALEQLGEGVTIIDTASLQTIYLNEAIVEMSGYTRAELMSTKDGLLSLMDEEAAAAARARLAARLAGEPVPSRYELTLQRKKDGSRIDIEVAIELIRGERDLWGEIREGVQDIRETVELGARLAKQLLNMGSSRGLTTALVDVTEVIEKMEHVLARAIADGAVLETNLCADECKLLEMIDGLERV